MDAPQLRPRATGIKLKKYGVMAPNYGGEPYFRYDLTPETRPIMR